MDLNYIIVQAGGKGSRMERLTRNKPKALVPVNNLPMIFHLFNKFPQKKFIIIADYKFDVFEKYLAAFANVDYTMVCSSGHSGTCSGLNKALSYVPDKERFMLIWCDIVLSENYNIPDTDENIIGISDDFPCRWKYENNEFTEKRSVAHGVAGHFIFKSKCLLKELPEDGEFVRWLHNNKFVFKEQILKNAHEYGIYAEYNSQPKSQCRPFNSLQITDGKVRKIPLDEQGRSLAKKESAWYKKADELGFKNIPEIYDYSPLYMEYIKGKNIYEFSDAQIDEKREMLKNIIDSLKTLHNLKEIPADKNSYYEAYIVKTFTRLEKIRELVPFAQDKTVTVNGRVCRNIFYHASELEEKLMHYLPEKFKLIHGDCTFSNIMLRENGIPILIDPRGYFGNTEYFGDEAYDWVKLYYSLFSNYDQFNLKRFELCINETDVSLKIASNNWEQLEDYFFELIGDNFTKKQMRLLLSIIWLSLTTYAWEDYDSICAAFYNGLYYLEEALS